MRKNEGARRALRRRQLVLKWAAMEGATSPKLCWKRKRACSGSHVKDRLSRSLSQGKRRWDWHERWRQGRWCKIRTNQEMFDESHKTSSERDQLLSGP